MKIPPMKGAMRFDKKEKFNLRYIGPYYIIRKVGRLCTKNVAFVKVLRRNKNRKETT